MPRQNLRSFLLATTLAATLPAQGTPLGFAEQFALAPDRAKVLEQLIPGTEDYYYYHCLQSQHAGEFARVGPLLQAWQQRHGRSARLDEIENRQALLTYSSDPAAAFRFLQERLQLRFTAERRSPSARPDLPTKLDPELLSAARLAQRALAAHPRSLDGFTDQALPGLAATDLDDDQLLHLLQRLTRPDVPNLPALIARNLQHPRSRGFGSLRVHQGLLQDQLEELVRLRPALLQEPAFVDVYLRRLVPGADESAQDLATQRAHVERLHAFAQRLVPAHNSLKAHVLHRWLHLDLLAGAPDRERLLAYLRLPRRGHYVHPEYLRRQGDGERMVDANQSFPTGLPPIGDDEPLVRACLQHFFATEDSYRPYAEFVREDWLRRLFAETKILLGQGDMEKWYSLLDDPAYYERLKERVEIEFPRHQKREFAAGEAVGIDVDVKNVDKLLVKVFVIDTFDYERETGRQVGTGIDLDGLVANEEQAYTYTEPALRRVRRHFDFPTLTQPGTYVVEFLGGGLASRAVIKKGKLGYVDRVGAAGQVLTVLDETGQIVRDAKAWCAGQEYAADARGAIVLPFVPERQPQNLVLRAGRLTALVRYDRLDERYALTGAAFVTREALLAQQHARLLVRPSLTLHGVPIALSLLEQPEILVTATDQDGIATSQTLRGRELTSTGELVHEFAVPERAVQLQVALRGRIKSLSQGKTLDLAATPVRLEWNSMHATPLTGAPALLRHERGHVLELRGKSGEPQTDRPLHLTLWHRDYKEPVEVDLETDGNGRIELGPLPGITALSANVGAAGARWTLTAAACRLPASLTGTAGSVLRLPWQGAAAAGPRGSVSLLETRGGVFVRDAAASVAIGGGFVELRDLPAGDYDLWLADAQQHVAVRVTAGTEQAGWAVGRHRRLELQGRNPLQITGLALAGEELQVQVANAGPGTRLHVFATRYLEPFDPFGRLALPAAPPADELRDDPLASLFEAGRNVGDEYRYILDRRYLTKYPGNMLRRPGLLLSPWAARDDESRQQAATAGLGGGAGGRFGGRRGGRGAPAASPAPIPSDAGLFADLEFLPGAAPLHGNLRPDAQGQVRVPRNGLGHGQLVHVLAVDAEATVYATLALPERAFTPRARGLAQSLDPAQHFSEQRRLEYVQAQGQATVADATTAAITSFDSLDQVYGLLRTLSGNADLDRFAFLMRWPQLSAAEKHAAYSEHACHELHFFLQQKDPAFFAQVVRPHLANKAQKTFLDLWLLDADLAGYLRPWSFAQLNVVEQILLTRRLEGQRAAGGRRVQELFERKPPDVEKANRTFRAALLGRALETARGPADLAPPDAGRPEAARKEAKAAPTGPAAAAPKKSEALREELKKQDEKAGADKLLADAPAEAGEDAIADRDAERNLDAELRKEVREVYRAPDPTKVLLENNWWHVPAAAATPDRIPVNAFWRDYALAAPGVPFCSPAIGEATSCLSEMLLALAVIDLPFTAAKATSARRDQQLVLQSETPFLLVRKEFTPATPAATASPILISQNYYRLDDRYRFEHGQRLDRFLTGEFTVDVPYGCQVVLTNPTSTPRTLDVLLQVPRGAVPVQKGFYTRGQALRLEPFATAALEYAFYFPVAGDQPHYPAHVSQEGTLLAFAPPTTLHVVTVPTQVDTTSWEHVSQDAEPAAVLAYLDTHNLALLDLTRIAWRMRDRNFFGSVLEKLTQRLCYADSLWAHGLLHGDEAATREYLRHADQFVARCGRALTSPLLTIDPVERRGYEHAEFEPLFHARAHRLGSKRQILSPGLAAQYEALLAILAHRPQLDAQDWLQVTYYLLVQDRIEEALASFARVDAAKLPGRLQYDGIDAWLAFCKGDVTGARRIATSYRDYPVARWQRWFRDALQQLDEIEGKAVATTDPEDRMQRQTLLAATEPGLEVLVEAKKVLLRYQNLTRCQISYYPLDVEASFSTRPFVQQERGAFAYVQPNRSDEIALPAGQKELSFDLPAEFHRSNVLVEVRGGPITRRQTYLSNSLLLQTVESYGHLLVTQAGSGKPMPKVYVKVYAQLDGGQVSFHKDGYTDLRGRFDYASVSALETRGANRFALLVLSETDGAVIREVTPPGR